MLPRPPILGIDDPNFPDLAASCPENRLNIDESCIDRMLVSGHESHRMKGPIQLHGSAKQAPFTFQNSLVAVINNRMGFGSIVLWGLQTLNYQDIFIEGLT